MATVLATNGTRDREKKIGANRRRPYAEALTRKDMAYPVTVAPVARDAAIASLSELLGDRLSTGESVRQQHGRDASYHACAPPDAVAFPQSTEEVSAIVKICARHKMPIVPFGVGSGMEGNVVALQGGSGQRTKMCPS